MRITTYGLAEFVVDQFGARRYAVERIINNGAQSQIEFIGYFSDKVKAEAYLNAQEQTVTYGLN